MAVPVWRLMAVSLSPVDRLLNPANRAHMVLEEQLRELLDMLDLTCAMKSSGSRSKRAKLLKKEIAVLRSKLSQQHSQPPAAESGTAGPEEDGAPRGQEAAEEGKRLEVLRAEAGVSSCLRRIWPLKNVGGKVRSVSQARFRLSIALQGGRRVRGWCAGRHGRVLGQKRGAESPSRFPVTWRGCAGEDCLSSSPRVYMAAGPSGGPVLLWVGRTL